MAQKLPSSSQAALKALSISPQQLTFRNLSREQTVPGQQTSGRVSEALDRGIVVLAKKKFTGRKLAGKKRGDG
jgi:hypothetical protein